MHGFGLWLRAGLMGFFRELLGAGTVLSGLSTLLPFHRLHSGGRLRHPGLSANPAVMMILPAGGFLMMGFIFAVIRRSWPEREDK